jgi:phytanoyl-CoA hydroxylase
VIGFWWALDDCSLENGCLWALPGSQKEGVKRHFRRKISGLGCEFHPSEEEKWDESDAKPLVIPAGTLVLLHNAVAHLSRENESENSRHAYSLHVIDGSAEYPPSNWLQREEPFRLIPTL